MFHALAIVFGSIVGLSLGMTGGGGSAFAVPLLVYGLGRAPSEAVAISLASVGATALIGALQHWRHGRLEIKTGLIFGVAGMIGAPFGAALSHRMNPTTNMILFALLMFTVAANMWRRASSAESRAFDANAPQPTEGGAACKLDPAGKLRLTSRCVLVLASVGVGSGALSGLFGVGGGFILVPAMVLFASLPIHRAAATSLMIIALVSTSALASHAAQISTFDFALVALFTIGGVAGMFAGTRIARGLPSAMLQKVFAVMIILTGSLVLFKNLT